MVVVAAAGLAACARPRALPPPPESDRRVGRPRSSVRACAPWRRSSRPPGYATPRRSSHCSRSSGNDVSRSGDGRGALGADRRAADPRRERQRRTETARGRPASSRGILPRRRLQPDEPVPSVDDARLPERRRPRRGGGRRAHRPRRRDLHPWRCRVDRLLGDGRSGHRESFRAGRGRRHGARTGYRDAARLTPRWRPRSDTGAAVHRELYHRIEEPLAPFAPGGPRF